MLPYRDDVRPGNNFIEIRRLACDESSCEFYKSVPDELRRHGMDTDDLRQIISSELGELHCIRTKPTEKYYPGTISDYFSIWIDECRTQMFLKLLIAEYDDGSKRLVVSSFKRDERYAG